ncbi:uncharacterized protein LOC117172103 [Belonocnema kinseyi]|uniref:uncharacterized protein LOC117172103 n=1 Tax=Belonocnema kinseyi TaxID=2817044 RepID=UPI00143D2BBA|nr:uncharacterized protein LOC117172103 [Belonocnema kinseyi]
MHITMKLIILFCLVLLVSVSEQIPQYVNCTGEKPAIKNEASSCIQVTCNKPGDYIILICPLIRCQPDKIEVRIPGDLSKEYPGCCDELICI